jgi:hypothetical protein
MYIGIDPGWASFGISVVDNGKTIFTRSYIPRDHGTIANFVRKLAGDVYEADINILPSAEKVYIERFVAYKGIHSDASEHILMLIGALNYYFDLPQTIKSELTPRSVMVRAIDWKPLVCKYLVRTQGFNNPHANFDKKFSVLAANALSGGNIKIDHEADAVCLSYLGEIERYNSRRTKQ